MIKPDFWFMLISEFVIGGLCIFFFYQLFLKPNAKSREEEMKERMERYDEMHKTPKE